MAELTTLARPYARAAFESARESNTLKDWSEALSLLAAISVEAPVQALTASPTLTAAEKSSKLIDVCDGKLNAGQQNFVKNLADYDRLPLLAEISVLFELYKANQEKSVDVNIETAYELDTAQSGALEAALKKALARDVELSTSVNKELVGGVFIRAGDTVIDASIRGRLQNLARAMSA